LKLALLLIPALLCGQVAKFRVKETAGLRRFSYPVRTSIRANETSLALFENGKQIPAQFTARQGGEVEIDFNASPGPWESIDYRVEKAAAGEAAGNTISVTQADGKFTVRVGAQEYLVPENLSVLLEKATGGPRSYVRSGSPGLLLNESPVIATKAIVTKRGPLVAGLRFESPEQKSVVEMEFPRSKSWVEVRWTVDDRDRRVTSMSASLNLLIEGTPTLVDFGADSTVYGVLRVGQSFTLSAALGAPHWAVYLNEAMYASKARSVAEGWAHVMDGKNATAIAVDKFGRHSGDLLAAGADGAVKIRRTLAPKSPRILHLWLHFVPMPVQLGAATSPQAILSPLTVERE